MADYTKTISDVYLTQLSGEITAEAGIGKVLTALSFESPDQVHLSFADALLSAEEAALDAVIAAHVSYNTILLRVRGAKAWAASEMDYWQETIIKEGVVQAGKAHEVSIALKDASIFGWLGNLYALDDELSTVTPIPTFLEQSRLDEIRNNVRAYLGMPLLWSSVASYVANNVVHHLGTHYVAVADNSGSEPPSADWVAV